MTEREREKKRERQRQRERETDKDSRGWTERERERERDVMRSKMGTTMRISKLLTYFNSQLSCVDTVANIKLFILYIMTRAIF